MPVYEFRLDDGRVVEQFFPMASAPEIGSRVRLDGSLTGTRIVSRPPNQTNVSWEHKAYTLPRWDKAAPHHDEKGRAVFTSRSEVDEYRAQSDHWTTDR